MERAVAYSDSVGTQLQISQRRQSLETFYLGYLILHEIEILQFHEMRDILDMLDLIKTEI